MGYVPSCSEQGSLVVPEHQLIHAQFKISCNLKLLFIAEYSEISGLI